jgi:2-polyprenyl-3-methyl-5-hydroxy-6-metoxy-1,4-benzoquinol methylase
MIDAESKWTSRVEVDPGLSHSLDLLSDTYNYNHWIYSLCRPWLGREILEVGAGIGNLTQFLLGAKRVTCVEPEAEYKHALKAIADKHQNVHYYAVPVGDIPDEEGEYDSVLCVNVLEHIEDEKHALEAMAKRIKPGGYVVLYVPAVRWAYGVMDEKLGHFRRYNRRQLRHLAVDCGLQVQKMKYVNFVGLWGWWWCGCIRKEALIDPRKARFMDALVPFVSALERIISPPVGQSILAVFQKT